MYEQNNKTQSTVADKQSTLDNGTRETAEEIKQKTTQTIDQVKQQTGEVAAEVKSKVGEMAGEVKHQVGAAFDDAKRQATDVANERKEGVSDRLHVVASALRDSGQQFEKHQESTFAEYVNTAADQVDQFAGYLETRDVGQIWQGASEMARRQPELFIVGSLAAGFFLGRFLKSSQSRSPQDTADRSGSYRSEDRPGYDRSGNNRPDYGNRQAYDDRQGSGMYGQGERRENGGMYVGKSAGPTNTGTNYGGVAGRDYSKVTTGAAGSSKVETPHDAMRGMGADDFNGERATKDRFASETVPGLAPDWRSELTDPQRTDPSNKGEKPW